MLVRKEMGVKLDASFFTTQQFENGTQALSCGHCLLDALDETVCLD